MLRSWVDRPIEYVLGDSLKFAASNYSPGFPRHLLDHICLDSVIRRGVLHDSFTNQYNRSTPKKTYVDTSANNRI